MMLEMLVVDDEETTAKFLKDFFSNEGFSVRMACSGKAAVEAILQKKADLILLDVQMPGMSGIEALKIIKEKNPGSKVLMVTAENDSETVEQTLKSGADYYVLKPFSLPDLVKQVRQMASEIRK